VKTRRWPKHAGDKKNSPFFEEYLEKIYERREKSGIDELVGPMRGVVVQVPKNDAISYAAELILMTPYRFHSRWKTQTHMVCVMMIDREHPVFFILSPHSDSYHDVFACINAHFPRAEEQIHSRYVGEIYGTKNRKETMSILQSQEIRFSKEYKNDFLENNHFSVAEVSPFTNNVIIYCENDPADPDSLDFGQKFPLGSDEKQLLEDAAKAQDELGISGILHGIDHLATRVFAGDREHAMLEFLTMTSYEFWGAFDIADMNSSTNVCRNPAIDDELLSPAKVFTANTTPFYVKTIDGLPSPTEDFVRNFGRRMHHIAYAVEDGEQGKLKNVEHVVDQLMTLDIKFLARIFGECGNEPDLKQIFSRMSQHAFLITEYIQRCHGFQGFFTKENVRKLTEAAGLEEKLRDQEEGEREVCEHGVCD
jgi:hypothetical protein